MQAPTLPAPTDERDTEPRIPALVGKQCGICGQPATAFVCEYCEKPLCEIHKHVRRVAGEDTVTCPAHTVGGA
jgi:hypothetical protein